MSRRITVPMLREHLEVIKEQTSAIIEHNAGGIIFQAEQRGELRAIEALLDDINNDIPSMLKRKGKKITPGPA